MVGVFADSALASFSLRSGWFVLIWCSQKQVQSGKKNTLSNSDYMVCIK